MAAEQRETAAGTAGDFVEFRAAGDVGKGEYRCSECSYGITVHRTLPACPNCTGTSWEPAEWSPFSRAGRLR